MAPIFLLLFAGMGDFAFLFRTYLVSTNAAREGARIAVLQGYDANAYAVPKARAADYMTTAGLVCSNCVTVTAPVVVNLGGVPPKTANGVRVQVAYTYNFLFIGRIVGIIGGTFRSNLPYQVSAVMRNELQGIN